MRKLFLSMAVAISVFGVDLSTNKAEQSSKKYSIEGIDYDFVIASGMKGGAYYENGLVIENFLKSKYKDLVITNATTDGSGQNIDLVLNGVVTMGFVQMDALNFLKKQNADIGNKLSIIILPKAEECVYLAVNSKVGTNEDDLQNSSKKKTIVVGGAGSGGGFTWQNMSMLEPSYKNAIVKYESIDLAMFSKLLQKEIDAILFITKPNPNHQWLRLVNDSKGDLKFTAVDDGDLNDKIDLGDGKKEAIYNFKSVTTGKAKIETICTNIGIVYKKDLPKPQKNKIDEAVLMLKDSLFQ